MGRGVLCYVHTYVGSGHFLGFKILNFNILGGGGGVSGHHIIRLYLGVISMHFMVFS